MGTDVSNFREKYKHKLGIEGAASPIVMPESVEVKLRGLRADLEGESFDLETEYVPVGFPVRYGSNPHQPFALYKPKGRSTRVGDMVVHKGGKEGFSWTNLQDIAQAVDVLKYWNGMAACVILKHLSPCGFAFASGNDVSAAYVAARDCDPRSAYGGTVGVNRKLDAGLAERIMGNPDEQVRGLFVENIVAPEYDPEALEILSRNEDTEKLNSSVRVVQIGNMMSLPKFWGDNIIHFLSLRTLPTGEIGIEVPYLTGVRTVDDLILDPEVGGVVARREPSFQEKLDALTGWYTVMKTHSNAVAVVSKGRAIGIGTGQQDRVGAVKLAIAKGQEFYGDLGGSVLASEAFFPSRDSIDLAAEAGITAFVWPAGSKADKKIIEAGNEHGMAMMVPKTGERCFLHI